MNLPANPSNPDPAVVLRAVGLTRTVPGHTLLEHATFHVKRAEVLAVLGPSGSGKSTLLRLLNRLDEPTSGAVELAGKDYRQLSSRELRRRVGMVMQRAYLFPGTVAYNIAFGPLQHGQRLSTQEISDLLKQVGLEDYEMRTVQTLSGGEAQRVAIARALANQPEVLLLDEPTSALDEASKLSIEQLLENIIHQQHLTCVWVTHDQQQAARMADRALLLEAGHVTAFGPARELLRA
ncbi:MAG: ABC transporter ATP-binding protein [Acidobacteriaceae bacterium]